MIVCCSIAQDAIEVKRFEEELARTKYSKVWDLVLHVQKMLMIAYVHVSCTHAYGHRGCVWLFAI